MALAMAPRFAVHRFPTSRFAKALGVACLLVLCSPLPASARPGLSLETVHESSNPQDKATPVSFLSDQGKVAGLALQSDGPAEVTITSARKVLSLTTNCFPADAHVMTSLSGSVKLLKDIRAGDKVLAIDASSGSLKLEEILSNNLQSVDVDAEHVTLSTSSGHVISATPSHQLFATSASDGKIDGFHNFANTAKIVQAASVKIGDVIWVISPETSAENAQLVPVSVTSVTRSAKRGMLNPTTTSGTLVVNGVLATTFTTLAVSKMPPSLDVFRIM